MLHLRAGHENRPWDNDTGRHLYVPTRSGLIRQVNTTPRAKCCRYRCASFLFRRTMRAVFVCCRSSCALGSLGAGHQGGTVARLGVMPRWLLADADRWRFGSAGRSYRPLRTPPISEHSLIELARLPEANLLC